MKAWSIIAPYAYAVARSKPRGVEGVVGASGWYYAVAYQADIAAALEDLRQEVYDRGEYYRPGSTGYTETSEE